MLLLLVQGDGPQGDPEGEYKVEYGSYHQHYRLDGKLIAVGRGAPYSLLVHCQSTRIG
jgi:hypothetical protein